MTEAPEGTLSGPEAEAAARKTKERVLVFIVSFLGLLIVAGLTAVILRIIYLSSSSPVQPAARDAAPAESQGAVSQAQMDAVRLALPPGASVKSLSLGGERLAVHYEAPAGAGIAVIDLSTGAVVRRVELVTQEAPR